MPELSVVVPVYNEEKTLPEFLSVLREALAKITDDYEVIFTLDPSRDRTEEMIAAAHGEDPRIKMLKFSRRFGQPSAIWAGLAYSTGQAVVVIDGDLQDPPELIPEMYRLWKEEGYKVVLPQRRSRAGENAVKRAVSYTAYWVINKLATVEIPRNTGDFRLLDRRVVDELMNLTESNNFLRGLTAVVGFKTKQLLFDRQPRAGGEGKYNYFFGNFYIGFNGIVGFSGYLLRAAGIAGGIMAALSVLAAIILPLLKISGVYDFASGLVTLGVLLLFLSGCQLVGMGILGAYIGRIYEETKRRPKFIVDESLGFEKK